MPLHLGLVPDGFCRWAALRGLPEIEAYRRTARTLPAVLDTAFAEGATTLSLFVPGAVDRWRPPGALEAAFRGRTALLREVLPDVAGAWRARVHVAVGRNAMPDACRDALAALCATTAGHRERRILVRCCGEPERPDRRRPGRPRPPDLLLRTPGDGPGGDLLPLRIRYAERVLLDVLFPELQPADVRDAMDEHRFRALHGS